MNCKHPIRISNAELLQNLYIICNKLKKKPLQNSEKISQQKTENEMDSNTTKYIDDSRYKLYNAMFWSVVESLETVSTFFESTFSKNIQDIRNTKDLDELFNTYKEGSSPLIEIPLNAIHNTKFEMVYRTYLMLYINNYQIYLNTSLDSFLELCKQFKLTGSAVNELIKYYMLYKWQYNNEYKTLKISPGLIAVRDYIYRIDKKFKANNCLLLGNDKFIYDDLDKLAEIIPNKTHKNILTIHKIINDHNIRVLKVEYAVKNISKLLSGNVQKYEKFITKYGESLYGFESVKQIHKYCIEYLLSVMFYEWNNEHKNYDIIPKYLTDIRDYICEKNCKNKDRYTSLFVHKNLIFIDMTNIIDEVLQMGNIAFDIFRILLDFRKNMKKQDIKKSDIVLEDNVEYKELSDYENDDIGEKYVEKYIRQLFDNSEFGYLRDATIDKIIAMMVYDLKTDAK